LFDLSVSLNSLVSQASFLEPPTVDFTVSSFGGVDLSAIPLAFQWMNGTIHWMLEQVRAAES
jgi:Ca2+-dependent lipid-binding protein